MCTNPVQYTCSQAKAIDQASVHITQYSHVVFSPAIIVDISIYAIAPRQVLSVCKHQIDAGHWCFS